MIYLLKKFSFKNQDFSIFHAQSFVISFFLINWAWVEHYLDTKANAWGLVFLTLGVCLAFRKIRVATSLITFSLSLGLFCQSWPAPSNHVVLLTLFVALICLAHLKLFQLATSGGRSLFALLLAVTYGFAVFHKLNWDFLLSSESCSKMVFLRFHRENGWNLLEWFTSGFPHGEFQKIFAISSLLVEALLGIAFFIGRTNRFIIALCLSFHIFLGFCGFRDFSTLIVAILFLVVPTSEPSTRLFSFKRSFFWIGLCLILRTLTELFPSYDFNGTSLLLTNIFWAGGILLISRELFPLSYPSKNFLSMRIVTSNWKIAFFFMCILIHGLSPYFGFRTVSNFSMFSNLRVEGNHTNHVFPFLLKLQIIEWTSDLVEVQRIQFSGQGNILKAEKERGQFRWLFASTPVLIPKIEIQRFAHYYRYRNDSPRLEILADGENKFFDSEQLREVYGEAPMWKRLFFAFRGVSPHSQANKCFW